MPEPRVVPRGRSLRPVPLPDGALDSIRARAHRRKTARAAVAGSAGTAALVIAASLVAVTGMTEQRDDSLQIVPAVPSLAPPPVPSEEQITPAPEQLEVDSGSAGPTREQQGAATQPRPQAAAPRPQVAAPAEAAAPQPTAQRTEPRYDPEAIRHDDQPIMLPPDCEQVGNGAVDGWCLTAWITTREISLAMCRARGHGQATLEWASSQRVRFQVNDPEGRAVWTYDPRVRPTAARLEVPAESCVGWRVPYHWEDEQGDALPPGDYVLRGASAALGLSSTWRETYFSVQEPGDPVEVGQPAAPRFAPGVPEIT